jgi:hypothetical protein
MSFLFSKSYKDLIYYILTNKATPLVCYQEWTQIVWPLNFVVH